MLKRSKINLNSPLFLFPSPPSRALSCSQLLWGTRAWSRAGELGGGCGERPALLGSSVAWPAPSPAWFLCSPTRETGAGIAILHHSSCIHIWVWLRGPSPEQEAPGELVGLSGRCPLPAFQEVSPIPHRQQPLDPGAEPRVLRQELLRRLPPRRAAGGAQREEGPPARGEDAHPDPGCLERSDGKTLAASLQQKRGGKEQPQLHRSPKQCAARRVHAARVLGPWTV